MEPRLRLIVGTALWGLYGLFIFSGVTLIVPGLLGVILGVYFAVFLVGGMALVWRLPGPVRFVSVAVELFVLAVGVGLAHHAIVSAEADGHVKAVEAVKLTTDYTSTAEMLVTAKERAAMWQNRVDGLDPTWVTAATKPAAELTAATTRVETLTAHLVALEKNPPKVGAGTAFDAFGAENAAALTAWVLLLFGVSVGGVALALMWRPMEPSPARSSAEAETVVGVVAAPSSPPALTTAELAAKAEQDADDELYYATAKDHGKDGFLAGYRIVAEKLEWSDYRARAARKRLAEKGRMTLGKE